MTITEFLLARIAEDEALANDAASTDPAPWQADTGEHWKERRGYVLVAEHGCSDSTCPAAEFGIHRSYDGLWDNEGSLDLGMGAAVAEHVARHDPARVLAECAAKRELVLWLDDDPLCHDGGWAYVDHVLKSLASVFADHPDFDPAWA